MLRVIILILIYFFLVSCEEKKIIQKISPVSLIFGLKSYDSITEVHEIVLKMHGNWSIVENDISKKSDTRPIYESFIVETHIFKDGIHKGKTSLHFFNKKLLSVTFYPTNWQRYKTFLEKKRKIILTNNESTMMRDGVKIQVGINLDNNYSISWTDMVLSEKLYQWILQYA